MAWYSVRSPALAPRYSLVATVNVVNLLGWRQWQFRGTRYRAF
jgi:hypothetical protein